MAPRRVRLRSADPVPAFVAPPGGDAEREQAGAREDPRAHSNQQQGHLGLQARLLAVVDVRTRVRSSLCVRAHHLNAWPRESQQIRICRNIVRCRGAERPASLTVIVSKSGRERQWSEFRAIDEKRRCDGIPPQRQMRCPKRDRGPTPQRRPCWYRDCDARVRTNRLDQNVFGIQADRSDEEKSAWAQAHNILQTWGFLRSEGASVR